MYFDVSTLNDQPNSIDYSQEEITLALRCSCDTRALRARRDYKPRGSALREELLLFVTSDHVNHKMSLVPLLVDMLAYILK